MRVDVGIVGGTGIGERLEKLGGRPMHVPTEFGTVRGRHFSSEGVELFVLSRHSSGHRIPPHRVAYAAMADALRRLNAKACLATAAVGSLRLDWPPGALCLCTGFLDVTGRNVTLYDRDVVHTDFTHPFGVDSTQALSGCASKSGLTLHSPCVYLGANGPRFETPQEISMFRGFGADVVGMTACSEAVVIREAGIDYGCLAIVTNLAAGLGESSVSHLEVESQMRLSGDSAVELLMAAAKSLGSGR